MVCRPSQHTLHFGFSYTSTCTFPSTSLCLYLLRHIPRVGRNHIYTAYIQYYWQGNNLIYGAYIRSWPTLHIHHRNNPLVSLKSRLRKHTYTHSQRLYLQAPLSIHRSSPPTLLSRSFEDTQAFGFDMLCCRYEGFWGHCCT